MEKRKYLTFLFCLILCYSLFLNTMRAQGDSSQISISSQGSVTYSPSNVNLAVIPDDWSLTYGSGPQIIYLDYSVTHNGQVSIRLEPHTDNDVNYARECDGTWYAVKPGDRIVAKCWMKIDNNPNETSPYDGARIGIDLYCDEGILDGYPHNGQEHLDSMVVWGTTVWTQKTWDFVIPDTYYTSLADGTQIAPTQVSSIVMWMQVLPSTALGNAWFADAELYINPT